MSNPIVEALLEDEDFQNGIDRLVDLANSTDELPLSEQLDQAISEHDTVLNLISRVEELEKLVKCQAEALDELCSVGVIASVMLLSYGCKESTC